MRKYVMVNGDVGGSSSQMALSVRWLTYCVQLPRMAELRPSSTRPFMAKRLASWIPIL